MVDKLVGTWENNNLPLKFCLYWFSICTCQFPLYLDKVCNLFAVLYLDKNQVDIHHMLFSRKNPNMFLYNKVS